MKKKEPVDYWKELEKRYKGVVHQMAKQDVLPVERLSTGVKVVDEMLGGGFPVGALTEIFGTESSGKTTLALQTAALVTQQQKNVLFIDAEQSFSLAYATTLGVDKEYLFVTQENVTEEVLRMAIDFARGGVSLIIIDSIASLMPRFQADGEVGAPQMGRGALILSQELRRVIPALRSSGATIIALNQIRKNLGVVYGNPEYQPGGNAMKFYASVRMQLRARGGESGKIEESDGGRMITASIVKNKTATPTEKHALRFLYGKGFVNE